MTPLVKINIFTVILDPSMLITHLEFYVKILCVVGENVREFFFRAVCLTFDMLVQQEVESRSTAPSKQIGNLVSKCNIVH